MTVQMIRISKGRIDATDYQKCSNRSAQEPGVHGDPRAKEPKSLVALSAGALRAK